MRSGVGARGYTIVESMIFLAVSAGLLASVMLSISGQQARTEFSTSVRDFENRVVDTLNDVETGYAGTHGKQCIISGAGYPAEAVVAAELGTSQDCIFLGLAVHFSGSGGIGSEMQTYTIAGRRVPAGAGVDPLTITQLSTANATTYGNPDKYAMPKGLEVTQVRHCAATCTPITSTFAFGILGSIGTGVSGGTTSESAGRAQLISLPATSATDPLTFKNTVQAVSLVAGPQYDKGLVICLRHGLRGKIAAVTVGLTLDQAGVPVPYGQQTSTEAFFEDEATKFGCTNT